MKTQLTTVLALSAALAAQELQSGPEAGAKLAPVKVYANSGAYKGREFDAAKELGSGPGAILFVKDLNRETAPIIRTLDEQAAAFRIKGFHSFTVWLTADRTAGEQRIRTLANALNMVNPMVVSLDGAEGPGEYAINRNATLTLVMVQGGAVTQSIGFTDTGIKDAPMVTAAIEAVAGKLPKTRQAWEAELPADPAQLKDLIRGMQSQIAALKGALKKQRERNQRNRNMRRGNQRNRNQPRRMRQGEGDRSSRNKAQKGSLPGKIPDDAEMQGVLRRFLRVKTAEELDAYFKSVDEMVGENAAKQRAMAGGFTRILKATTYGTDAARKRAQAWCDKHNAKKKKGREGR